MYLDRGRCRCRGIGGKLGPLFLSQLEVNVERACKNCDYYVARGVDGPECRKACPDNYPPAFPPTCPDWWCGEMAPKGTWNKMQRLVERMEREALGLACLSDEIEV